MGPVVITGDLAGMVLLAIAITVAARKPTDGRRAPPPEFGFVSAIAAPAATAAAATGTAASNPAPATNRAGTGMAAPTAASNPAAAVVTGRPARAATASTPAIPAQARWQARSPALVEDRVSGPAPLQLEESVGSRDQ